VFAVVTVLVAAGLAACSGSSSTALPPTTGILIRAETLTAGHGCGKDPTQLFKYAVVVFGYGGSGDESTRASYTQAVTSNVFDCFTDGAFISLPPTNGSSSFRLEVYAFNEPAYSAARTRIDTAGTNTTPDLGLRGTTPTWTTECTATQQENVQALASCAPLAPGLSGLGGETAKATRITLATARFELPDGRVATCGTDLPTSDGGLDGGDEGGLGPDASDDAGDASAEAAAPDAGGPIRFTTVRVRPRINATIVGPSVDLACPTAYLADVAPEPVRYELDVALLDSAGQLVEGGQTVCTVTSVPGETSSAVCP
jgi:hypothetical protein